MRIDFWGSNAYLFNRCCTIVNNVEIEKCSLVFLLCVYTKNIYHFECFYKIQCQILYVWAYQNKNNSLGNILIGLVKNKTSHAAALIFVLGYMNVSIARNNLVWVAHTNNIISSKPTL